MCAPSVLDAEDCASGPPGPVSRSRQHAVCQRAAAARRAFSQSLRRAVAMGAMPAVLPRTDRARAAPSTRQQRGRCGASAELELQRLVLEELLEPVLAGLAAVARLLEAAERRVQVERPAVDVDLP